MSLKRYWKRPSLLLILILTFLPHTITTFGLQTCSQQRGIMPPTNSVSCTACKLAVPILRKMVQKKPAEYVIEDIIEYFCIFDRIEDKHVCESAVREFKDVFFYVLEEEYLRPEEACGVVKLCPMPIYDHWNVTFGRPKPPVEPYPTIDPDGERIYILHLTDLHVDQQYTVGLETDCGEPICCRPPNGPGRPESRAKQWGDHNCDTPPALLANMLKFISMNFQQIDFVVVTGDLPAHNVWEITREEDLEVDNWTVETLSSALQDIPIYFAVGNHESVPVNQFVPRNLPYSSKYNMTWLYEDLAEKWSYWLPEDAVESVRYAGYYTVKVSDGLRIVSLNTNLGCNDQNWWLSVRLPSAEENDPDKMLHWLESVLDQAEMNDEQVLIIMHIATGPVCLDSWWRNYHAILLRYENNVIAEFAGHTHNDEFHVNFDKNVRPFANTYFAGSITPLDQNPTFRLVEIDKKTKAIVDYVQYYANLTEANLFNHVDWKVEYTASDAYNLSDMSPESWHDLCVRFSKNSSLFDQYLDYQSRCYSEASACDLECHKHEFCALWNQPPDLNRSLC